MRLVEVVVLMGAHCVSPVEHSQLMMTEATKVQCAVVVEKDTDTGVLKVTPQSAANDPHVTAAIARFSATASQQNAGGTRIVPAFAPAGQSSVETKPPVLPPSAAQKPAAATETASADATPGEIPPPPPLNTAAPAADPPADATADTSANTTPADASAETAPARVKKADAAPRKAAPAAPDKQQQVAAADPPPGATKQGSCKGNAVAKWYKEADGHRKYRCVRPEPAGDSAPTQLY